MARHDVGEVEVPADLAGSVYTAIAQRRTAFDTLMWQVPALGLTAQAFLLTIAYGSDSSEVARYVSGALSLVIAAVAIQTMRKHQANELTDSKLLEKVETAFRVTVNGGHPHAKPPIRAAAAGNAEFENWVVRRRSFKLWVWSLRSFALASLVAMSLTAIHPETLEMQTRASAVVPLQPSSDLPEP